VNGVRPTSFFLLVGAVGSLLGACSSAPVPTPPPPPNGAGPSLHAAFTAAPDANLDAGYFDTSNVVLDLEEDGSVIHASALPARGCRPTLTLSFDERAPNGTYALAPDTTGAKLLLEEKCEDGSLRRWVATEGFVAIDQNYDGLMLQVDAWMTPHEDEGDARGKLHAHATAARIPSPF
jgi:hypothetical protein